MREILPIKFYKDEGFVERKIEINEEDLTPIIEEYLRRRGEFNFDEIEIVNNRDMDIWLFAKCRTYVDPDASPEEQDDQASDIGAEVRVISGKYPPDRLSQIR